MKKAALISGSIIAVFVLISTVMAADLQNFCRVVGADEDNVTNESLDFAGNVIHLFPPLGDSLPLQSWGSYKKVDLAGENYFAAYLSGFLYSISADKGPSDGQLCKILQNNRKIQYIGWDGEGTYNLILSDGYELALKSIDFDGNKLYVELTRAGQVVDSKVMQPLKPDFTIADKTYYYKSDVGSAKGIVTIAVHIQTIVGWASTEATLAVVDGVWQISDTPTNSTAQGSGQASNCCSMTSPISLGFSGMSGVPTVVSGVLFTILWKDVEFREDSLWCLGAEEFPSGSNTWHDAAAKMDFQMLPCKVCTITAQVDGHGPVAKLEGQRLGSGSVVATTHSKDTLTIQTPQDDPFVSAIISGKEAEWKDIRLE